MRLRAYSRDGWAPFLPLESSGLSPQVRTASTASGDRVFIEGMRLPNMRVLGGILDYWRIYEAGFAATVQSYRDDYIGGLRRLPPYLSVGQALLRLHSLLVHARVVGEEITGVELVPVRMDWRGLAGKELVGGLTEATMGRPMAADRFVKAVTVPWAELRDRYFEALLRVALPLFDAFPNEGWPAPDKWLTRDLIEAEFARVGAPGRAHLFGD